MSTTPSRTCGSSCSALPPSCIDGKTCTLMRPLESFSTFSAHGITKCFTGLATGGRNECTRSVTSCADSGSRDKGRAQDKYSGRYRLNASVHASLLVGVSPMPILQHCLAQSDWRIDAYGQPADQVRPVQQAKPAAIPGELYRMAGTGLGGRLAPSNRGIIPTCRERDRAAVSRAARGLRSGEKKTAGEGVLIRKFLSVIALVAAVMAIGQPQRSGNQAHVRGPEFADGLGSVACALRPGSSRSRRPPRAASRSRCFRRRP